MKIQHKYLTLFSLVLSFSAVLTTTVSYSAAKNKNIEKKNDYVMTEIELQSKLMSYADRFASIMANAFEDFLTRNPSPESRRYIMDDVVHAVSAVFTIAAEPNPQAGLLDMVVITMLGRMIYEDNFRKTYGKQIDPMTKGFSQLEKNIWSVAEQILSNQQQQELRKLILGWRKLNPNKITYAYFRFNDFDTERRKSTLVKKDKTGGLFKSVQKTAQQMEETRMMAERSLYIATRMWLLVGTFSEVWMSRLIVNPDAQKILQDFHTFADVSKRLAAVTEQFPDQLKETIATEREASINQFMDRLFGEQKIALQAIVDEEQDLKELVIEIRKVLEKTNNLLVTADTLSDKFNSSEPSKKQIDSKPFDINAYQAAVGEVSNAAEKLTQLVESGNRLISSDDLEKTLVQLIAAVDSIQKEGEELLDHFFLQAIFIILIAMAAYIVGKLIHSYLNKVLIKSKA